MATMSPAERLQLNRDAKRAYLDRLLLLGQCRVCGEGDPAALVFDYRTEDGRGSVRTLAARGAAWKQIVTAALTHDLLCLTCKAKRDARRPIFTTLEGDEL